MNVNGSVIDGLYGGGLRNAAVPPIAGQPEGPQAVLDPGVRLPGSAPAPCSPRIGMHAAGIGTAALVLLGLIWAALPR